MDVSLTSGQDTAFVGDQLSYAGDGYYDDISYSAGNAGYGEIEYAGDSIGCGCASGGSCGSCGDFSGYSSCSTCGGGWRSPLAADDLEESPDLLLWELELPRWRPTITTTITVVVDRHHHLLNRHILHSLLRWWRRLLRWWL